MAQHKNQSTERIYGTVVNMEQFHRQLTLVIKNNKKADEGKGNRHSIGVFGEPGIGKTEGVWEYAAKHGMEVMQINPAQFEEMGDLVGMPYMETNEKGEKVTRFATPDSFPQKEAPNGGLFFIDDMNRADDRILRGCMQLIQKYMLAQWSLPKGWNIVISCNPEGSDHSVTSMDEAMESRFQKCTMKFDIDVWLKWLSDKGFEERFIMLVTANREVAEKLMPREMVRFAEIAEGIDDWQKDVDMSTLLHMSFDNVAAQAFDSYLKSNMPTLLSTKEIINNEPEVTAKIIEDIKASTKGMHINLLNAMSQRLFRHCEKIEAKSLTKEQKTNICNFLANPNFDKDLFFVNMKTLTTVPSIKDLAMMPFTRNGKPVILSTMLLNNSKTT